ncbi:MAG TPA: isochorismatase family cysteine hydrolase [Bryobacteraceae bacterium]|jgi:nicotinamidase/pyrazinamidase|nr:isochorismatase family cysteine hydrolase [Bryobacteraceae bacterium]
MRTLFFDIDTQIDFIFPSGALYAPGAEKILPTVARLNHHAAKHRIPVISTMDAHSENDAEFVQWPHHCVVDTFGQRKPASTLLENRVIVPNSPSAVPIAEQILLEKQTFSALTNVNFALLLDHFQAERYVVYGVVTEVCVKFAAFGLLETGKRVEIVTDAVCAINDENGAKTLADFQAAGGHLTQAGMIYA